MRPQSAKLISVGAVSPEPCWFLSSHLHSFHEIIVPMSGKIHVNIAGQIITASAGQALFYPARTAHEERSDREHPLASMFVAFNCDCPKRPPSLCVTDVDLRIRQAILWLYSDRDQAETAAIRAHRNATLSFMLQHYLYCACQRAEQSSILRALRTYMRQHLTDPITLDDLASLAGLSRFHLIRQYHRWTGRSPIADLSALRLERARELLLSTDMKLKAIAPQCGFGSEYALSRAFRRHFGLPPSQLRHKG